jgi:hypothetical protein
MRINNKKGSLLILSYMIVFVLISLGGVFALLSLGEAKSVERERRTTVAFNIAEAGIERALYDLKQDYVAAPSTAWRDGTINTYAFTASNGSYATLAYPSSITSVNNGSFAVQLQSFTGLNGDIYVRSVGTFGDQTQTIQVYVKMVNVSPWNNAIFAGTGSAGAMVNGNVTINGSVHILGTGLASSDYAIDLGGTAELVGNNYNGISATLLAKVPALPTTVVNGVTVSTLNASLRVKRGKVGLSGSSTVGEANNNANTVKEKVDGSYVTDGFGGTSGSASVNSDNGWSNGYDLGNSVSFPSLNCGGTYCDGYYNSATGLNSDAVVINSNVAITPTTNIAQVTNGSNSFKVVNGNITISGKVYIKGTLTMSKAGSNKTVTYDGNGTILTSGDVQIDTNLYTNGNSSFPTNIMAIMTPGSIGFNEANIDVMGLFYGETSIVSQKQTNVMGTFVSNYFNMGTNVPKIFQVPEAVNHLPSGLVGGSSGWYLTTVSWQKL